VCGLEAGASLPFYVPNHFLRLHQSGGLGETKRGDVLKALFPLRRKVCLDNNQQIVHQQSSAAPTVSQGCSRKPLIKKNRELIGALELGTIVSEII
jgi:hypothetical protein